MSHQSGIDNCICCFGTALTSMHLGIIKRYSKNLVLAFDMDTAGNKATEKAIELAGDFNVKVIPRIKDKDPADIILHEGEETWKNIIEKSKPISEFFFNIALINKNIDLIEDKKKILKEFLPRVKNMESAVEQSYWIEKLVDTLKIKEEDVRMELKKIGVVKKEPLKQDECLMDKKTRRQMIEEKILALILKERARIELVDDFSFFSSPVKEILERIKESKDVTFEKLQEELKDNINFLNYIFLKSEVIEELEEEEELKTCILEIQNLITKEKQHNLHLEIKDLEKKGDFAKVKELLEQFKNLIKYEEKNKEKEESCAEEETSKEETSKEEGCFKEEETSEEKNKEKEENCAEEETSKEG
jgi:DNA primase